MADRPGREIPKEYREVVIFLIETQGWRYETRGGGRHSKLLPPDRTQPVLPIPGSASDHRAFANWCADIRRRGGRLPQDRR